jgi:Cys-rich protein (TIGR01571 family)
MAGVQTTEPEFKNVQTGTPLKGEWKASLFDCFSAGTTVCCTASFCPCVQYGYNSEKMVKGSCCSSCCVWFILAGLGVCCFVQAPLRGSIRGRFNIESTTFRDCCISTFCTQNALCQEAKQLE